MGEKRPVFYTLWFSVVMSVVCWMMFADYARLVATTDDSTRRVVVLCIWGVVALAWTITSVVRWRAERTSSDKGRT